VKHSKLSYAPHAKSSKWIHYTTAKVLWAKLMPALMTFEDFYYTGDLRQRYWFKRSMKLAWRIDAQIRKEEAKTKNE